ncbi:murein transglycosylase A [Pseudomonas matsuisoli]|nr:MltA domain-containing protein [Pseudomonas matsuisoli]
MLCIAPLAALLAGCDSGDKTPPEPKPEPPKQVSAYSPASWDALPKTSAEDTVQGFTAWRSACKRLAKDANWGETCAKAADVPADAGVIRQFLQDNLQVYSLRGAGNDPKGLVTGYYEPVYPGSLERTKDATVPVYGIPDDMIVVSLDSVYPELKGMRLRGRLEGRVLKPYDDAATIREQGAKAPVVAWLHDPMDLQFLQIQGSGRVQLQNGRQLRLGYADQNGRPYRPVGRWLVENGLLPKEEVSMGRIRDWATQNPGRVAEMLASNPSYVFFAQGPDSNEGPRGSLNVPLTAEYSVAIDRKVIPLGSLLWLSTTRPDNGQAIARPVAAQDTGGAIVGEVRADFFWGTGPQAGDLAGNMKQDGTLWLLWPKGKPLPDVTVPAKKAEQVSAQS